MSVISEVHDDYCFAMNSLTFWRILRNSDPVTNNYVLLNQTNSDTVRSRLSIYGLRPLDGGGGGDGSIKYILTLII